MPPVRAQGVWPGLLNLELVECRITARGCEVLREQLAEVTSASQMHQHLSHDLTMSGQCLTGI
jgi:hypothetical protein